MAINQARENEIATAAQNPSILSALSGAPSQSTSSSPPPQQSNPIPPEASEAAQGLSSSLYGKGYVSGGESANDAVLQQLFQYDKMLESNQNPFPTVPGYVNNPADMYSAGAEYAQGVGQVSGSMGAATSNAERGYQAAIAGLLDKFLDFARLSEEKKFKAEDREEKKKQQSYETSLAIAKLMGGYVNLPNGERVYVPADSSRAAAAKPKYTPSFLNPGGASAKLPTSTTPTAKPPLEMFDLDVNP